MNPVPSDERANSRLKMPWYIKFLLAGLILFTTFQLFKFIQVLVHLQTLRVLDLNVSPLYLAVAGLAWGAAGAALTGSILSRKAWSPALGTILSLCYCAYYWIDRTLIADPLALSGRLPFRLALTLLALAAVLGTLQGPASRRYFGKNPVKIP